jgi:hypothetical protein
MSEPKRQDLEVELRFANAVIHEAKEQIDLLLRLLDEKPDNGSNVNG